MRTRTYKNHKIELTSEPFRSGKWVASATIVIAEGRKDKRIPIFGRRRMTFDAQRPADRYALELAKLWIDGRLWGGNGRG